MSIQFRAWNIIKISTNPAYIMAFTMVKTKEIHYTRT